MKTNHMVVLVHFKFLFSIAWYFRTKQTNICEGFGV